jgi:hypothetical protein
VPPTSLWSYQKHFPYKPLFFISTSTAFSTQKNSSTTTTKKKLRKEKRNIVGYREVRKLASYF